MDNFVFGMFAELEAYEAASETASEQEDVD